MSPQVPGRPRTVAFYLPQFHAIPENDAWWGEGFTEWHNVRRAVPAFEGHDHPRVPGELGYYDLTEPDVMRAQAALAREHDVDAFCFYHYWFGGTRLLERPVDDFLTSDIDMPFCLSWANESWTRRWDGKDQEVLMGQDYGPGAAEAVFESFVPYLRDARYLRVDGAAVLLVHRAEHLPEPQALAATWRVLADRAGVGPLHLVAAETVHGVTPEPLGFDAVAEFPPVGANTLSSAWTAPLRGLTRDFRGRLLSYERIARTFSARPAAPFTRYPGVMPGWDNTARRGPAATVYVGSSPVTYARWLRSARERESRARGASGLVFVNAWNEWAEGAYLEPDRTHGRQFLEATRWRPTTPLAPAAPPARGAYGVGQALSLARIAGSSALRVLRRVQRSVTVRTRG
ncbi:glycoside hydrolase family 99-like domain-containing protein [Cellulomonas cellasea]|uniref:Lipopolysaccharide biosynthesis protein n=1 Tax=Cellulomonas cellasea TaxID=43670 RepID=A0A7W4YCJ3_9CELL|nr:glycoside hydrolase family 99-like domain-containing protein [Cellulomonas cellasea]MBB2924159.1 lipopolysaccharide biosynthesis protein [Cellulomonas cellasea]